MSVDFDAIARHGRCDVSSLKLAQPLLEQGYAPPFLSRYRRDELGGIDESSLWRLSAALKLQQRVADRREALLAQWKQSELRDPALGNAIKKANSPRVLSRLARRMKSESAAAGDEATRLAIRVLNPQPGDGHDFAALAAKVDGISDPSAAVAGLDQAAAKRLMGDPRMISAATRWLAGHAKLHIAAISDPHSSPKATSSKATEPTTNTSQPTNTSAQADASPPTEQTHSGGDQEPVEEVSTADTPTGETDQSSQTQSVPPPAAAAAADDPARALNDPPAAGTQSVQQSPSGETSAAAAESDSAATPSEPPGTGAAVPTAATSASTSATTGTQQAASTKSKSNKKISPRQRRRRWLVATLKPLAGKRIRPDKLSSFQFVMLGRALRSQVAKCAFQYDAAKLVEELQQTAAKINRVAEQQLRELVLQHEADLREAAEAAWWDDLVERASSRLLGVTADHLRRHVDRGAVDATVVMSIDAVGPRTAATAIVAGDGRVLHTDDIPCQLSNTQRSLAVTRMGELIHDHHVDLIVISNGPARRGVLVALADLIKQSPADSIRWTLADRSGADVYAGSAEANREMRSTPRRFRASAWLAFSVLQPAQAIVKIDPLKLRLNSFQKELAEDTLLEVLDDVLVSGACRGGVDANSTPATWLARLPGVSHNVAQEMETARRQGLFRSRDELSTRPWWDSAVQQRQAMPFLRVFNSEETLDGTLVHPDDYALAKKLAGALEIPLPPPAPPGYQPPQWDVEPEPAAPVSLTESEQPAQQPLAVEEFTTAGEHAPEFRAESAEQADSPEPSDPAPGQPESSDSADTADTAEQPAAANQSEQTDPTDQAPSAGSNPAEASAAPSQRPLRHPLPDAAKIDKCVKEWQIGPNRAQQIVGWLCDPFGGSDVAGAPPAVLTSMPALDGLKPGDQVIGVVVGVMPFGVFVELAPACSGLIHVSRLSESYVEDLHEAVQVGDVITTWVVSVDQKKRRVALSAISPDRMQALETKKAKQRGRGPRGDRADQSGRGRGGGKPGQRRDRGGTHRGGATGKGKTPDRNRGRQGGKPRGGRQGSAGRSGSRQPRKLESYRVTSKEEPKPLSDDVKAGKEPMRSFGDLAQFFDAAQSETGETDKREKVGDEDQHRETSRAAPPPENPPATAAESDRASAAAVPDPPDQTPDSSAQASATDSPAS